MSDWSGIPDYLWNLTRVGCDEARSLMATSWNQTDRAELLADSFFDDSADERIDNLRWHGYDEAFNLLYDLYPEKDKFCGDEACHCQFSRIEERWDFEHDRSHLSYVMGENQ